MSTAGTLYDEALRNGMLVLLATNVASNSASLNFTDLGGPYSGYLFDLDTLKPNVNSNLILCVSGDNGATFKTTDYNYQGTLYLYSAGAAPGYAFYGGNGQGGGWLTNFYLALSVDGNGVSGRVRSCGLSPNHRQWLWDTECYVGSQGTQTLIGAGFYGPSMTINAVRFAFDGGNIASGAIRLYGLRTGDLVS